MTNQNALNSMPRPLVRLDAKAADVARKVGTGKHPGVFHGQVPPKAMAWLYQHVDQMREELVKTHIGVDVPPIVLSVDVNNIQQLGHYKIGRDGIGLNWRISMNLVHLGRAKGDVLRTLLHEMLHASQHAYAAPGEGNYHNSEFRGWCEKLGIPTNEHGLDQGTVKDSLMAKYLKKHRVKGVSFFTAPGTKPTPVGRDPLVPRDLLPKRKGSRLRLFVCGCAKPVRVRVARDEFHARCNDCLADFRRVD